jgi:hypothetical protein
MTATAKVGLRNGCAPTDLMARGAARKRGVSKACPELVEGHLPALGDVSARGSVLRGRLAAPQDEVVGSYNDSEMAPQAIEIAQNGLGNGEPPVRGRWEGAGRRSQWQGSASGCLAHEMRGDLIGGRQGRLCAKPRG